MRGLPHTRTKAPSLFQALIPLVVLIVLLALNVSVLGDSGLDGPNQIALLLAAAVAMGIGLFNRHSYTDLLEQVVRSISTALGAVLILLMIGALAGTWLISGVVPAMIDHGLKLLSPTFFLFAACVVCCIVSLATGSSWSTVATVGIALLGIGRMMGFHEGLVAGGVISGAYFGDKLSPMSDTTNLAPAVAGTDLVSHIRYMLLTTVPSISIALILFLGIGLWLDVVPVATDTQVIHEAIASKFRIGWWLYLVPLTVLFLIWRKTPALVALFIGTLMGGGFAVIFQGDLIRELAGSEGPFMEQAFKVVVMAMGGSTEVVTGNASVDELLSSGGMYGMMRTIWLIICALAFGGAMEGAGLLQRLARAVMGAIRGDGSLIATTSAGCMFTNVVASDQYLAIVVPGRMFAPMYAERGLDPKVLSRTLEDSGTVTSVLVPWNTCGAYMSGVLGVATMTYLPFCFFNLISPLMTMLQGALGYRIARIAKTHRS